MAYEDYNGYDDERNVNQSMNQILDKVADEVIKSFSGKGNIQKIRVIDNQIAFIGAAGGTGTSTIISNVAFQMAKKGLTVLIVDLNIEYPIQQSIFRVKQQLEKNDLVSFIMGRNEIGASIEVVNNNISIMYANNRYMMDKINCDTQSCSTTLVDTLERIRHLFDVILFDCPLQLDSDIVNSVLYHCDTIYCIWDESLSCIANMDRIKKNMRASGIEADQKVRVIFNKRTNIHYTKYIFEQLGIELVGTLPFDVAIIESGLQGEVFSDKGASLSKTAAAFSAEIEALTGRILEIGGYNE